MDEISGLLVSGGVLLAASLIKGVPNDSRSEVETEEIVSESEETFDEEIDQELRKQRKRFDAEFENILRNTHQRENQKSLIILSNPFYTSFHKLQDALQTIKIPTVINTNIKQRYLLVNLGQWLMYSSSLYDPESEKLPEIPDDTLLFQLLVSNGLVLTPAVAYGNSEPGVFVMTRDVQDEELLEDILERFRNVQAILENLYKKSATSRDSTHPAADSPANLTEVKADDVADDISVSSRTRGRKRASLSGSTATAEPDTASKRKKKQML